MQKYETAVSNVASELFDGELVIANYGSGLYYAISESGALIWQGLRHGLTDEEVGNWLASHYQAQASEITGFIAAFIAQLQAEGLLIPVVDLVAGPASPPLKSVTFDKPKIERFDDFQDLLLADPVHDVDSTGWPRLADDNPR